MFEAIAAVILAGLIASNGKLQVIKTQKTVNTYEGAINQKESEERTDRRQKQKANGDSDTLVRNEGLALCQQVKWQDASSEAE